MEEKRSGSATRPLAPKPHEHASPGTPSAARQHYDARLSELSEQLACDEKLNRRLNFVRGGIFFAGLILLSLGYGAAGGRWWLVVPGWSTIPIFLAVITWHESIRERIEAVGRRRSLYRQLVARLDRNWEQLPTFELPDDADWLDDDARAVALDLDLFGVGSLYQLVSLAGTTPGKLTLARWLAGPGIPEIAQSRNQAVRQLAEIRDRRESFYASARDVDRMTASPENFSRWASDPPYLSGNRAWLLPIARVIAVTPLVIWGMFALGAISLSLAGAVQLGAIVVSIIITVGFLGGVHEIFKSVATRRSEVENYVSLFDAVRWIPEDTEMLQEVRQSILCPQRGAIAGLRAMAGLSAMTGLRHSPILFLPYLALQFLGLWDVHVLAVLERWKQRYGPNVNGWFESLGQLEAILSLSALAFEYPNWTAPAWHSPSSAAKLEARSIGHPLLGDADRVTNDVEVGPAGTLLLVTGSNMSGKSTLLRSIGLNIQLAAAGSVVCADQFAIPACEVATSIRVHDSLHEGVSFYMAELHRLREVVDHADRMDASNDRMLVYLLDEILQGTNSRERQIAVATVLEHLVEKGAIGAISTHDLELADDPSLQSIATTVHFREQIEMDSEGNETMTFDYKMRSGVTPTTNAIRLLEMVGLGKRK